MAMYNQENIKEAIEELDAYLPAIFLWCEIKDEEGAMVIAIAEHYLQAKEASLTSETGFAQIGIMPGASNKRAIYIQAKQGKLLGILLNQYDPELDNDRPA